MASSPSETTVRVWARLLKAQRHALEHVEARLKAAGLPSLAWYDVLVELDRAPPAGLRPFELEREVLLAQYNLSRLLDRLEREGYIDRQPCEDDGRGHRITITRAGKAIRRKMWEVYAPAIEQAVGSRLTATQATQLSELLGLLVPGRG